MHPFTPTTRYDLDLGVQIQPLSLAHLHGDASRNPLPPLLDVEDYYPFHGTAGTAIELQLRFFGMPPNGTSIRIWFGKVLSTSILSKTPSVNGSGEMDRLSQVLRVTVPVQSIKSQFSEVDLIIEIVSIDGHIVEALQFGKFTYCDKVELPSVKRERYTPDTSEIKLRPPPAFEGSNEKTTLQSTSQNPTSPLALSQLHSPGAEIPQNPNSNLPQQNLPPQIATKKSAPELRGVKRKRDLSDSPKLRRRPAPRAEGPSSARCNLQYTYGSPVSQSPLPWSAIETRHVSPRSVLKRPGTPDEPPLMRTSQILRTVAVVPKKENTVELCIHGDLLELTEVWHWDQSECLAGRRLVRFWRWQQGSTVHAAFKSISSSTLDAGDIVVSCIYRRETKSCFITSVDLIYLLESLVGCGEFSIQEKNRVRRNLETFQPQTLAKDKPGQEFFKAIMELGEPKPRKIEKDIKVFTWETLEAALRKVMAKYSSYYPDGRSSTCQSSRCSSEKSGTPLEMVSPYDSSPEHSYHSSRTSLLQVVQEPQFSPSEDDHTMSEIHYPVPTYLHPFHVPRSDDRQSRLREAVQQSLLYQYPPSPLMEALAGVDVDDVSKQPLFQRWTEHPPIFCHNPTAFDEFLAAGSPERSPSSLGWEGIPPFEEYPEDNAHVQPSLMGGVTSGETRSGEGPIIGVAPASLTLIPSV